MKRSERYYLRSRHNYFMALTVAAIGVAIACWTPCLGMIEQAGAAIAVLAGTMALTAFGLSISMFCDACRHYRMSKEEAHWEEQSSIRPRL